MTRTPLPPVLSAVLAAGGAFALALLLPAAAAQDGVPSAARGAQGTFYTVQDARDWLAQRLVGRPVANGARETVGNVQDLVVDGEGRVKAVVIGVGGFLGVGEKPVAVSFEALRLARDANGAVVPTLDLTRAQLEAAPAYRTIGREGANATVKP